MVFVAGGGAIGLAGYLTGDAVWNPVLAGWTYAGDLLAWGALAVSFPVAIFTRSPGCELGALPPGGTVAGQVALALVWAVAITAVFTPLAIRVYRRTLS